MLPLLVRFIRLLSIGIEIKLSLSELVMSDNCDMNGAKWKTQHKTQSKTKNTKWAKNCVYTAVYISNVLSKFVRVHFICLHAWIGVKCAPF